MKRYCVEKYRDKLVDAEDGDCVLYSDVEELVKLVNQQAEDEGLWFQAETAPEAYLQHHLRELHRLIEDVSK